MREYRKSAPPNVPVTNGGAGPLGVLTRTGERVSVFRKSRWMVLTLTVVPDVGEHLLVAHLPKRQFNPIAVREEILKGMQGGA